jgi:acyl-coenzyme A thioesterase PaaI-like protein
VSGTDSAADAAAAAAAPRERHLDPAAGGGYPGIDGLAETWEDSPLNRLAAATRRIGAVAVGQPLGDDEVAAAAVELSALADRLEAAAQRDRRTRKQPSPEGHPQDTFSTSPVIGFANPVAPPVEVWAVEGHEGWREVRGRVTFGYAYEGPPTCVHGGVIAELFDELLGMSNILVGSGAMTGTLTIRYRRPTPLLAPLDLAARHTGKDGRKVYAWGGIYSQGELTAEAEGVFIEVPPDRMLNIVSGNANNTDAPLVVDPDWRKMMERAAEKAGPQG